MGYQMNREAAESIADESLIWAMNAIDRLKGKGSASQHPDLIASFAQVYVQAYYAGTLEALTDLATEKS